MRKQIYVCYVIHNAPIISWAGAGSTGGVEYAIALGVMTIPKLGKTAKVRQPSDVR